MTKKPTTALLAFIVATLFFSCAKHEYFDAYGGELPGNYVIIQADGTLGPYSLEVASGSSVTFVNDDVKPHSIMRTDNVSIVTNVIPSKGFYKFKNDALVGSFPYKSLLDSSIKGIIIITP